MPPDRDDALAAETAEDVPPHLRILRALLEHGHDFAAAAKAADSDVSTVRRAWLEGWPHFGIAPVRDLYAAKLRGVPVERMATDQELASQQEAALVYLLRSNARSFSEQLSELLCALRPLVERTAQTLFELSTAPAPVLTKDRWEYIGKVLRVMGEMRRLMEASSTVTDAAVVSQRRVFGESIATVSIDQTHHLPPQEAGQLALSVLNALRAEAVASGNVELAQELQGVAQALAEPVGRNGKPSDDDPAEEPP